MAQMQMPYSGSPLDYAVNTPEFQFFRDVPGGSTASPVIVPAWAAIESGGHTLESTNLARQDGSDSLGGGAGGYTPSGSFLGGSTATPANFSSNFGTAGSIVGTAIGLGTGSVGLGSLLGGLGGAIDAGRYSDVLNAAGIAYTPDYWSAGLAAATGIPFTDYSLLGTSARQQSEDARRNALAEGKLGTNVSPGMDLGGHTLGSTADIAEALGIGTDEATLATLDSIRSQNPDLFGALIGPASGRLAPGALEYTAANLNAPFTVGPMNVPMPTDIAQAPSTANPIPGGFTTEQANAPVDPVTVGAGSYASYPAGFMDWNSGMSSPVAPDWGSGSSGSYGGGYDATGGIGSGDVGNPSGTPDTDAGGSFGGDYGSGGGYQGNKRGGRVKKHKRYQQGGRVEEDTQRQEDFLITIRNQGYTAEEINTLFRRQFDSDVPREMWPYSFPDELHVRQNRWEQQRRDRQRDLTRRNINPHWDNRNPVYWMRLDERSMAGGGRIDGPGDGLSDSVPAIIDGMEPARLATDEHVLPADVISLIGNGSSNVGHKRIAKWISQIRQNQMGRARQISPFRGKTLAQLA